MLLEISRAHRFAKQLHLAAAVVEIIFARDVEARRLVKARDGVTEHGVAAVADGEGAGGIGGEKLDLDFFPFVGSRTQLPCARLPERAPVARRAAHLGMPVGGRHLEIDEARARDRDFAHFRGQRDARLDNFRDHARWFALGLGDCQRDVRGDVAVGRVPGRFDSDRRNAGGQLTRCARPFDCVAKDGDDQIFHL